MSLLSTIAYAGPKYEITPMVGKKLYNYSDDAPRFDDGEALAGVRANAYINSQVSVQLGFEASKGNKEGTGMPLAYQGAETDLERGMLSLQYDIPSKGKITPYVFAGGGYEKLHRDEPATNVDSQAFYNVGAGLRYAINEKVDLVAEGRVIHKVEDQDDDAIGSVGLGFKFGQMGSSTCKTSAVKGIPVKALSIEELAALTPKKPVVKAPEVAPVAPAVVKPEPVSSEVVDSKIVYDTSDVNVCDVVSASSSTEAEVVDSCVTDSVDSVDVASGYYVQVIALRKNSPDVIISRLSKRGYDYVLKEEGDLKRVLVGPYMSRKAASRALSGLRKIRRDAFIYHNK